MTWFAKDWTSKSSNNMANGHAGSDVYFVLSNLGLNTIALSLFQAVRQVVDKDRGAADWTKN